MTNKCGNCGRDLGVHTFCNACLTNVPGAPPPFSAMERIGTLEARIQLLERKIEILDRAVAMARQQGSMFTSMK